MIEKLTDLFILYIEMETKQDDVQFISFRCVLNFDCFLADIWNSNKNYKNKENADTRIWTNQIHV